MCGFLAVLHEDKGVLEKAVSSGYLLDHRGLKGKEYRGLVSGSNYVFMHLSLPIMSIRQAEFQQPRLMTTGSPLVYAGEIFNYPEVEAKMYEGVGVDGSDMFQTDIDLIQVAAQQDFVRLSNIMNLCDGFWSFAYVDQGRLVACTDYLAQKPVYYRTDMNAVCSEPYPLTKLAPVTPDKVFRSNTLKWGYDSTGRTPWSEIRQLKPGHLYIDGVEAPYWDWDKVPDPTLLGPVPEEVSNSLIKSYLNTAVENRMRGFRKVAMLLSGGLDSSIVYKLLRDQGLNIDAYHVDNHEDEFAMKMVKSAGNGKLRKLELEDDDLFHSLMAHQSPVDLGSVRPQFALGSALKDQGVNVCMTGDGADELFGGYSRSKEYDSQGSDVFMELPYYHNPRLDRLMMVHTVELRTPFMAPYVVAAALKLDYKRRTDKQVLREIATEIGVPREIVNRDKLALKTDAIREDLRSNTLVNWDIFDKAKVFFDSTSKMRNHYGTDSKFKH